ncbi:hypothetical protein Droror1_Dr00019979 [Drosera rotundifolia]
MPKWLEVGEAELLVFGVRGFAISGFGLIRVVVVQVLRAAFGVLTSLVLLNVFCFRIGVVRNRHSKAEARVGFDPSFVDFIHGVALRCFYILMDIIIENQDEFES